MKGHTVIAAKDGREAARLLQADKFDLLISDISMPERDGLETLMALRRDKNPLPEIAISGMAGETEPYLKVARNLGPRRTLPKPFTREQLLLAVNEVLSANKS